MELVLGIAFFVGLSMTSFSVTGNANELCKALGGTYTPAVTAGADVCPGGSWANLFKKKP